MKKIITLVAFLLVLLCASAAMAEGMGVQVIGGPAAETEPVSLDDIKMNIPFTIDGYGNFEFTSVAFVNHLVSYEEGNRDKAHLVYNSGEEAEYLLVRADILNCTTVARDYMSQLEVKVVFDEVFEYGGWGYQYNYNNGTGYSYSDLPDGSDIGYAKPTEYVISSKDNFAINPMYEGHFVFGCTLPNAVVESKAPLQMIITIGGNELTYNIRK